VDGSQVDHGLTAVGQLFVVLAQASITTKSGEGAFDHPAAWQDVKADLLRIACHDLQNRIQLLADPVDEGTGVAAIRPEFAEGVFGGLRERPAAV
jgi:hypothetical protein